MRHSILARLAIVIALCTVSILVQQPLKSFAASQVCGAYDLTLMGSTCISASETSVPTGTSVTLTAQTDIAWADYSLNIIDVNTGNVLASCITATLTTTTCSTPVMFDVPTTDQFYAEVDDYPGGTPLQQSPPITVTWTGPAPPPTPTPPTGKVCPGGFISPLPICPVRIVQPSKNPKPTPTPTELSAPRPPPVLCYLAGRGQAGETPCAVTDAQKQQAWDTFQAHVVDIIPTASCLRLVAGSTQETTSAQLLDLGSCLLDLGSVVCGALTASACFWIVQAAKAAAMTTYAGLLRDLLIVADPPDPNYTSIAQPPSLAAPTVSSGGTGASGVNQSEADAMNAVITNSTSQIETLIAMQTSINRYQGAEQAGDLPWSQNQLAAVRKYAAEEAQLIDEQIPLDQQLHDAAVAAGVPAANYSADQVQAMETNVATNGIGDYAQAFTSMGIDSTVMDQVAKLVAQAHPATIGNFIERLTDPTLVTAERQEAQIYREIAGTVTVGLNSFTVSFTSSSPGQGRVYFGSGPGCQGLIDTATQDQGSGTTSHTITVTQNELPGTAGGTAIVPDTTYWYELATETQNGEVIDNNNGQCYSVYIPPATG